MTLHTPIHGKAPVPANNRAGDAVEYLLHRLDCEIDALRGEDLSAYQPVIDRLLANLLDLKETVQ